MSELKESKPQIIQMASRVLKMWQIAYDTFMEHDRDLIPLALEEENHINLLEKDITQWLINFSKESDKKEVRHDAAVYADVVGDLEIIADYCKDLLERIEIKIDERLLFSEEALGEYQELYKINASALKSLLEAIEKEEVCFAKVVLKDEDQVDHLVDKYREKHNQRLLDGICDLRSGNIFLNMLDFNAAVHHHIIKIARSILRLR
ncbi:MAG: PhoU domain-containing protein [Candidatus Omnitrophota bacterium]